MKVLDSKVVNVNDYNDSIDGSFIFLRIDPEGIKDALLLIMESIMDKSWLSVFDNEPIRKSFEERATITIKTMQELFDNGNEDPLLEDVGEYIVSYFALQSLNLIDNFKAVPLMELLGEKATGNHGFDFYSEMINEDLVICGEAKYLASGYGYNSSLKQINDFISNNKHIIDAYLIEKFISKKSLEKLVNNEVGICSAFSSKNNDEELFKQITNNKHFVEAFTKHKTTIIVAVEI